MSQSHPLVTIGIPTYNRATLLKRAIASALNQDYQNIEVIVSDNGSTDDTEAVCREFYDQDVRLKFVRHSHNRGAAANFDAVLDMANGLYFMWLGDDDWIDVGYVSSCVQQLICNPAISLASGVPEYYRNGHRSHCGKVFDLLWDAWWLRVIVYYCRVSDNGMFYGVMRTAQIQQLRMPINMGGDWHLIANIVSLGKTVVVPEVSVHRELGGTSQSYQQIAASLALGRIHAAFPMCSIAAGAWMNIVAKGIAYRTRAVLVRLLTGCMVLAFLVVKGALVYLRDAIRDAITRTKSPRSSRTVGP